MADSEQRALAWLYSLADQERGVGWNPRASADEQWKLGRTRALLDLLGKPDARLRVVLVAGTKGKGSTCAMLASILAAAGVSVGLYTKPHLQSYRERIRVDGGAIGPEQLLQATERVRQAVSRLPEDAGEPTTFEVTTALAVDHFAAEQCAIAVVEVGLGGRLDATNALNPELSVITSISYDHTAILGRTLGEIAREKAGILRPDRAGLVALQRPAAARALRRACRSVGARCVVVPPWHRPVPLLGQHQQQNAGLAIAAARALCAVSAESIECGLARLRWPGRFEIVDEHLGLDGAHNGASAEALAELLRQAQRPLHLVLGINRDKDARAVLKPLLPLATGVWATQTRDNPRALPAAELGARCRRLGVTPTVEADNARAVASARAAAVADNGFACVTGSLMLVGQARASLGLPVPEKLWDSSP